MTASWQERYNALKAALVKIETIGNNPIASDPSVTMTIIAREVLLSDRLYDTTTDHIAFLKSELQQKRSRKSKLEQQLLAAGQLRTTTGGYFDRQLVFYRCDMLQQMVNDTGLSEEHFKTLFDEYLTLSEYIPNEDRRVSALAQYVRNGGIIHAN